MSRTCSAAENQQASRLEAASNDNGMADSANEAPISSATVPGQFTLMHALLLTDATGGYSF